MDDMEDRIREHAHRIWREEGCPDGRAEAHWAMALEAVAQEDNAALTTAPDSAAADSPSSGGEPVKPPEAPESRGVGATPSEQGAIAKPPGRDRPARSRTRKVPPPSAG